MGAVQAGGVAAAQAEVVAEVAAVGVAVAAVGVAVGFPADAVASLRPKPSRPLLMLALETTPTTRRTWPVQMRTSHRQLE